MKVLHLLTVPPTLRSIMETYEFFFHSQVRLFLRENGFGKSGVF